ncbi:MAG: PIN domain-containing protein [Spirochaetaceae bacterium]|nr:MAG: PIN domain-containing protein [Spirochaetaceae bacterium]
MTAYLDSSALVKLYYPEEYSDALQAWVHRHTPELLVTPLHSLELLSAMAQKEFRGEITQESRAQWEIYFERDQVGGVLSRLVPDWPRVFDDAGRITRELTRRIGTRSLDVLHIAVARLSPIDLFVTNDARQGHAAREAGLTVRFVSALP